MPVYDAIKMFEELFTATEFVAAGVRQELKFGADIASYLAPDQVVRPDQPIVAFIEKHPASDHKNSIPSELTPDRALELFMFRMLGHDMPPIWTRQARDWLAYRRQPDAELTGRQLFKQFAQARPDLLKRFDPRLVNTLTPPKSRASLKVEQSKMPQIQHKHPMTAPDRVFINSRPFFEKAIANQPTPQGSSSKAYRIAA